MQRVLTLVLILAFCAIARAEPDRADLRGPLDFVVTSIDGESVDLGRYRGRVVLIVNVASRCGLTPQYAPLESLYRRYRDRGLVVLGFPANDFGAQEPGTNEQIRAFCKENYQVSFPMFAKIVVTGEDAHPLYKLLASLPGDLGGEPRWNFTKFLVDRTGKVVARFEPRTRPDDPRVIRAIERLLGSPTRGLWF